MHSKTQKQKQTLMMKLLQLVVLGERGKVVWSEKGAYCYPSMFHRPHQRNPPTPTPTGPCPWPPSYPRLLHLVVAVLLPHLLRPSSSSYHFPPYCAPPCIAFSLLPRSFWASLSHVYCPRPSLGGSSSSPLARLHPTQEEALRKSIQNCSKTSALFQASRSPKIWSPWLSHESYLASSWARCCIARTAATIARWRWYLRYALRMLPSFHSSSS